MDILAHQMGMTKDALAELGELLEQGNVIVDPDLLASFSIPMRGRSGRAAYVVEPRDVSEVSAVAAWAYRHHRRLVVQGANTGLVGASTPDDSGVQGVVSLRSLDRVIALSTESKTVDVEAGVTLIALNDFLAGQGLFFPVGIGSNPTVGGMISTNAGGAHTLRYGNAGDQVVAVEGVIADENGSVIGGLQRPRKDNSRLGISRMFIGSYGSLGVIVRARLSLAELPESRATALLALTGYGAVPVWLRHLRSFFGDALLAFELISGEAMRLAGANVPVLPRPFGFEEHACYVLVEVGSSGTGSDLEESLARALDDLSVESPDVLSDAVVAPPSELWLLRHSLSDGVRGSGTTLRFDISMSPDDLPVFRSRLESELGGPDRPQVSEFGHWGDGGTHLQLVYPVVLSSQRIDQARKLVYDLVVHGFAGSFSAEHGLGPFNAEFYEMYIPLAERRVERRLKTAFDPHEVWGVAPFAPEGPMQAPGPA